MTPDQTVCDTCTAYAKLQAENEKLEFEIGRLSKTNLALLFENEKHRWIPVSERLPEKVGCYLLLFLDELIITGYWNSEKWQVYATNRPRYHYQDNITHWKPVILPEQPKKGE